MKYINNNYNEDGFMLYEDDTEDEIVTNFIKRHNIYVIRQKILKRQLFL